MVRYHDETHTIVEAIDPQIMHQLTANDAMAPVAERIRSMLSTALTHLSS